MNFLVGRILKVM